MYLEVYFKYAKMKYKNVMELTGLFKINRTLHFAFKTNSLFRIDLPFGGHHIYPIHGSFWKINTARVAKNAQK